MQLFDEKIIIAIDGFSSCGKSTFARKIASMLGYVFIDTGAMYRAVTLGAIRNGAFVAGKLDNRALADMLDRFDIDFVFNPATGSSDIYLNGENVEDKIRSIEVSSQVSEVSSIGAVREKLVAQQQLMGLKRGVVMDGRDIGTVVFPDAELKIFMTADLKVRAKRRYDELRAKGEDVSMDQIEDNICSRDMADQNRSVAPLRKASDAVVLDNSYMSVEEQMEWVVQLLKQRGLR